MAVSILGISAYYHDSAAALVRDGEIVAAAQEERFSRRKHDCSFPARAIAYCLREAGLEISGLDRIVFYEKPWIKFERLLETHLAGAPRGFRAFLEAMPVWLKEKLFLKQVLRKELAALGERKASDLPALMFTAHHASHAASAFYPSPFSKAAVLCLDGVGEWATTTLWMGEENRLRPLWEINFPHSLGLLYSAFTSYAGFKVNSGEYKLMGLAPYGEPRYADLILSHLVDLKEDGTFRLNMDYFDYAPGLRMTNQKFERLVGGPARAPEEEITQRHMDLARSIQSVTEDAVLRLARTARRETGAEFLCLAGGVALNCVANGLLLREAGFKDIWIQPAASDAGGALGAALAVWHEFCGRPRDAAPADLMRGALLGPRYSPQEIRAYLDSAGVRYCVLEDAELLPRVAHLLANQNVVGWFQGRMEFGPRALGARSILGDPRNPEMQSVMNLKIKYRESFRPFAPSVLAERAGDYFELDRASPYMLLVAGVKENQRLPLGPGSAEPRGMEKLNVPRSRIPAVTHVDYSARIQTVDAESNPRFHTLLRQFEAQTGCAVLINTSFNVRGEPIVCTPEDAYRCFMRTEMDFLVMENILLAKSEQPGREQDESWRKEFQPD